MKRLMLVLALLSTAVASGDAAIRKNTVTKMTSYLMTDLTSWGGGIEHTRGKTYAASTEGRANCLSFVKGVGTSSMTVRVLSGSTTIYADSAAADGSVGDRFNDEELCSEPNTALHVILSTGVRQAATDTHKISVSAYTY